MVAIYDQTCWTTPTGYGSPTSRTVSSTDSTAGRTITITYVVSSAGDQHYVSTKKPEPIDLTDWVGLSRWYVGISGSQSNKKAFTVRKIPSHDTRNIRRLELQKLRNG